MKPLSLTNLEKQIIHQFQELAILDYLAFSSSENQADELFIEQTQTWFNLSFIQIVDSLKEKYSWNEMDQQTLKKNANCLKIDVNNKLYDHFNYQDLNKLLIQEKSSLRIQWSMQSESREFVVGFATEDTIDEFQIYKIHTQICSSFGLFIPMVAMINNNEIMLREPCIDKMIELKWQPILTNLDEYKQLESMLSHDLANYIGVKLRNNTLQCYEEVSHFNIQFKADCKENVLYHEFGHAVIQNHCIQSPLAAIAETFQVFSEDNAMILCLEMLADIAPQKENKKGVLTHIFSMSDPNKAKRCLAMYFADVWFFDTQEERMFYYSEILSLIFIKYSLDKKDIFLTDFSFHKTSKLRAIINLVETMVIEFNQLFLTKNQLSEISNQVDYVAQTKCSQKILQDLKESQPQNIAEFLEKNKSVIKEFYTIFDARDIYHDSDKLRRQNLFEELVRVLA